MRQLTVFFLAGATHLLFCIPHICLTKGMHVDKLGREIRFSDLALICTKDLFLSHIYMYTYKNITYTNSYLGMYLHVDMQMHIVLYTCIYTMILYMGNFVWLGSQLLFRLAYFSWHLKSSLVIKIYLSSAPFQHNVIGTIVIFQKLNIVKDCLVHRLLFK